MPWLQERPQLLHRDISARSTAASFVCTCVCRRYRSKTVFIYEGGERLRSTLWTLQENGSLLYSMWVLKGILSERSPMYKTSSKFFSSVLVSSYVSTQSKSDSASVRMYRVQGANCAQGRDLPCIGPLGASL